MAILKVVVEGILVAALSALAAFYGKGALVVTIIVCGYVWLWLHGIVTWPRRRPKGRKGILNLQVDVPRALRDQDARLHRFAALTGQLHSAVQAGSVAADAHTGDRLALSTKIAASIRPIAARMTGEAKRIRQQTDAFSNGMNRWLEIAEREQVTSGLAEQVPALAKTFTSGPTVLPGQEYT